MNNNSNTNPLPPSELDKQSPVKINRWIEVDSPEAKELDNNLSLTKRMIRYGFEDRWMTVDKFGRIWGHDPKDMSKPFFPFHFENGKELIGYRMAAKAAN